MSQSDAAKYGKKIDKFRLRVNARMVDLDLRFDQSTKMFATEWAPGEFVSHKDLDAMKEEARTLLEKRDAVQFEWVISVSYEISANHFGAFSSDDPEHEGFSWDRVTGFTLKFEALKVSQEFPAGHDDRWSEAYRLVVELPLGDEGFPVDCDSTPSRKSTDWMTLVPYTPERWTTLVKTREGLQKLARLLYEALGDAKKASKALDGQLSKLLPAFEGRAR